MSLPTNTSDADQANAIADAVIEHWRGQEVRFWVDRRAILARVTGRRQPDSVIPLEWYNEVTGAELWGVCRAWRIVSIEMSVGNGRFYLHMREPVPGGGFNLHMRSVTYDEFGTFVADYCENQPRERQDKVDWAATGF